MEPELTFALLDDLLPIADAAAPASHAEIRTARPCEIGPLVEYAYQARQAPGRLPSVAQLRACVSVRELRGVFEGGTFDQLIFSASHDAHELEFHWIPPSSEAFTAPSWVMFQRRVQNAAQRAGFSGPTAAALTGAFGEMADNAFLHSLCPATALCGYRWSEGSFEYLVADAGQGILSSLRSCSNYAHLRDAGDALQVALTEGESRLGRGLGRGRGFREVFLSLVDLRGRLRFRSGDHALTIDGTSPDLSQSSLAQLGSAFNGFLVSVVCSPISRSPQRIGS